MAPIISVLSHVLILLSFKNTFLQAEKVLNTENEDFDFDGLPGVTYEFKVEVLAGKEQCFYQKIAKGASLHVSYEVLRGADRMIDFYIDDPHVNIEAQHSRSVGAAEKKVEIEGVYAICFDNTVTAARSLYGSKLIYFYMVTYVMEDWDKYLKEIESVSSSVTNFTTTISSVQLSIEEVNKYQAHSRMNVVKDWYLIVGNNSYIMWWSILQIGIIICISAFQVYSVRRLFKERKITPTAKPRA